MNASPRSSSKAPGPAFYGLHGLNGDQYQQRFNELVGQGFRPVVVSGYAIDGKDRYAAIFEQRTEPPFIAHHGLSGDQYQRRFDELVGQGFRPVVVSGYTVAGQERYAAIFEQRQGAPFVAHHGLSADQYRLRYDELVGQGYRLVQVNGYTVTRTDRYAVLFEQRAGPPFVADHGLSADQYQQRFNELVGRGFRPVQVSGYAIG